jgi:hypothetical protein
VVGVAGLPVCDVAVSRLVEAAASLFQEVGKIYLVKKGCFLILFLIYYSLSLLRQALVERHRMMWKKLNACTLVADVIIYKSCF